MLTSILVDFFKYKVVHSIIVLTCWSKPDQIKLIHQLSQLGVAATVSCDPSVLKNVDPFLIQGVAYIQSNDNSLFDQVKPEHLSNRYQWMLIGNHLPESVHQVRYDAELTFLRTRNPIAGNVNALEKGTISLENVHIHPREGASIHPWGSWSQASALVVMHDRARILRKRNLRGYPLRIAAPIGYYSEEWYNGSYVDYMEDETLKELDAGIRCGYRASKLVIDAMNASNEMVYTLLWATMVHNSSMPLKLWYGEADLSGAILRVLTNRLMYMDYIMPIWPFSVGFTYLAERESSSNMYVEPFSDTVWWSCLAIGVILAIAQRITSKSQEEKDGAYYAVLATWLQQDASAVPNGIAGRWTFLVLSICSMLVHAYYTSAIVSALMSSGRSGPDSLRSLADSKYAIASEDVNYMRYLMFEVKTNWDELEYLKKKKRTPSFYQELERGVELIREGGTAFHTEYNQIFPHFKTFTDDQICKLQHVDTIPESMAWITTTKNGQYTEAFKCASTWILEVGLGKRTRDRLLALRPPCRSALLAERVNFGDVAPLLGLTASGAILSLILLGLEIIFDRWKNGGRVATDGLI